MRFVDANKALREIRGMGHPFFHAATYHCRHATDILIAQIAYAGIDFMFRMKGREGSCIFLERIFAAQRHR
jgi:hypothetical protein